VIANMEIPTAAERIQIARWSAIRDSCSQRVVALIREPHAGMSQGLWQNVAEVTEHNGQRQHALMMALARGEMPYGQFVQEDTLIGVRTAAAIRPFTQEAGVIDQVAMAAPAADQSADCRRVLLCKWASPLPLNHGYQIASVRFRRVSGRDHPVSGADDRGRVRGRQRRVKGRITYRQLTRPSDVYCRRVRPT
jgi:hypothetical protein